MHFLIHTDYRVKRERPLENCSQSKKWIIDFLILVDLRLQSHMVSQKVLYSDFLGPKSIIVFRILMHNNHPQIIDRENLLTAHLSFDRCTWLDATRCLPCCPTLTRLSCASSSRSHKQATYLSGPILLAHSPQLLCQWNVYSRPLHIGFFFFSGQIDTFARQQKEERDDRR